MEVYSRSKRSKDDHHKKIEIDTKRSRHNSSVNSRLASENAKIKERLVKTKSSFYGPSQSQVKVAKKLSHQD